MIAYICDTYTLKYAAVIRSNIAVAGWVKDDCESGDGDDKEENDAVAEAGEGEADFFDSNLSFNSCSSSTDFRFMARTIEATGILLRTRVKKCIGIS